MMLLKRTTSMDYPAVIEIQPLRKPTLATVRVPGSKGVSNPSEHV